MAFWRLRHRGQAVEIFTYLRDHVDSQKQPSLCLHDCSSSAKIHFLRNEAVGCCWAHSGLGWEAHPSGCPGAASATPPWAGSLQGLLQDHLSPSHLTLIQTGSWPWALKTKLREKQKHLGSLWLNTQGKEFLLAPRLHSLLPLHCAPCLPHRHAASPQESCIPLLWEPPEREQGKQGQDRA